MSHPTEPSNASTAAFGPIYPGDRVTQFEAPSPGHNATIKWEVGITLDAQQTVGAPTGEVATIQAFYPPFTYQDGGVTAAYTLIPGVWALKHIHERKASQVSFTRLGTGIRQTFPVARCGPQDIAYVSLVTPTQATLVPLPQGESAFQVTVENIVNPTDDPRRALRGTLLLDDGDTCLDSKGCETYSIKETRRQSF
jgi:hypothetical protein